jgi:hypothetical protein
MMTSVISESPSQNAELGMRQSPSAATRGAEADTRKATAATDFMFVDDLFVDKLGAVLGGWYSPRIV